MLNLASFARNALVAASLIVSVSGAAGCAVETPEDESVGLSSSELGEVREAELALSSIPASEKSKKVVPGLVSWSINNNADPSLLHLTGHNRSGKVVVRFVAEGTDDMLKLTSTGATSGVVETNAKGETVQDSLDPAADALFDLAVRDTMGIDDDEDAEAAGGETKQGFFSCGKAVFKAGLGCAGAGKAKAIIKAAKAILKRNPDLKKAGRAIIGFAGYSCACAVLSAICECKGTKACAVEKYACW